MKTRSWKDKFNKYQETEGTVGKISDPDDFTEDVVFNRPIKLRGFDESNFPLPSDKDRGKGKIIFDKTNNKVKIFIDNTGKWADLLYTSTSTSTTSTSTTSSSTSTTSSSTSSSTSTSTSTSTTI